MVFEAGVESRVEVGAGRTVGLVLRCPGLDAKGGRCERDVVAGGQFPEP